MLIADGHYAASAYSSELSVRNAELVVAGGDASLFVQLFLDAVLFGALSELDLLASWSRCSVWSRTPRAQPR
jgi:hypothetical protein